VNIAVSGIGCRFPGGIVDLATFWQALQSDTDVVTEVPPSRWDALALHHPDPRVPGSIVSTRGGFLQDIERFDAPFFGISSREADRLDPQQRLLLEVGFEALEDAGLDPNKLRGDRTGVYVGISHSDYWEQLAAAGDREGSVGYALTGNELALASGRLAYTWGLTGPAVTLATACSSALVAVHQALRALRSGECDRAIAGGVNVVLSPSASQYLSRMGALSPSGACRPFDAAADGYVRAEGCGLIVLERLETVLSSRRRAHAVLRGSAINQDGRTNGLTAPSGLAQEVVIRQALADAQIEADTLDLVEAHGTGTTLGDPIELHALAAALGERAEPVCVSAVKSRLGHSESAAGIAGVIAAILALQHAVVPGTLHLHAKNPLVQWERLPLRVDSAPVPLPARDRPHRAGVSSFGFSGTNAHVILEAPPPSRALAREDRGPWLVPLAGHDEETLRRRALELADHVEAVSALQVADIAATLARRAQPEKRTTVVAADRAELVAALRRVPERPASPSGAGKLAFLFTGQGSAYPGMGRGLHAAFPTFRDALEEAEVAFSPFLQRSVSELLLEESDPAVLEDTTHAQPALFALEYALAKLWASFGVRPDAVMGHSLGEIVAACVAGAVSLDDAAELVAARAQGMGELPAGGAMASVRAPASVVRAVLERVGGAISLAAINADDQVVISGAAEAVARAIALLARQDLTAAPLHVSHAFHSPLVEPAVANLVEVASRLRFARPQIPLVTNLTGAVAETLDAEHWGRHITAPVRFADGVRTLAGLGVRTWLELGPHPVLVGLASRSGATGRLLATLKRGAEAAPTALAALGALWEDGRSVQWPGRGSLVALPSYPFRRERHWTAPSPQKVPPASVRSYEVSWVPAAEAPGELAHRAEVADPAALLEVIRDWTAEKGRVAVVTREAWGESPDPNAAAVWGLARSWRASRPPGRTLLVDLPRGADLEVVHRVAGADEDELRFDGTSFSAPRLLPAARSVAPPLPSGPIVVTGAMGALGVQVVRWLVGRGAGHILALGRRAPSAEVSALFAALPARIDVCAVDISDRAALARALAPFEPRGVMHLAGVAPACSLSELDQAELARVMAPKVEGARHLSALVPQAEWFVLASSISSTLGSPDGAYAAANAWLDAFARARRHSGLPAVAVAFGPWAGPGMGAALDGARLARLGLDPMAPEAVLAALDGALGGGPCVTVAALDGARLARGLPYLSSALRGLGSPVRTAPAPVAERPRGEALMGRVRAVVAEVLGRAPAAVPLDRPLVELGLDSLLAVEIRDRLAALVGRALPAPVVFDHPTVTALSRYLDDPDPLVAEAPEVSPDEPIAVVGLACRFPGAPDPEAYWRLLLEGRDAVSLIPPSRWDREAWYDPDPDAPGRTYVREGAFLEGVEHFDARFFGMSPREARHVDPQQRILLEVSYEALERAAIAPDSLAGTRTGVFVGLCSAGYDEDRAVADISPYSGTGNAMSVAAGRISYTLDLHGPSVAIDTACSSSLVAVHQACTALRAGECTVALAGGVNLVMSVEATVSLSKLRVLSPTGRCHTFGAAADGYVRGEGAGMLVLKRLQDARRDGDTVHAVLRGSAVNHDGRSQGLAAPSGPAQQRVIRSALAQAGLEPAAVGYVECHGTGTALGDPIEVEALAAVLGRDRDEPLWIGAVKSNIGHAEGAAGVAGLIKAIYAVREGVLPPTLHCEPPNPRIPWEKLPLRVVREQTPWRTDRPRVAGVSSFGFGGTNAHVVVQEPPPARPAPAQAGPVSLVLSARTETALDAQVRRLLEAWEAQPELTLDAVARTLAVGRATLPWRLTFAASSRDEALAVLRAVAQGELPPGVSRAEASEAAPVPRPAEGPRVVLPTYPFERVRHWMEREDRRLGSASAQDPLIGTPGGSALHTGERTWEISTDAPSLRFLRDHGIEDVAIVPGATWLCAAARAAGQEGAVELLDVRFDRPLALDVPRQIQLALGADRRFVVGSRGAESAQFTIHARGSVRATAPAALTIDLQGCQARLTQGDATALYQALDALGFHYGPSFQGIAALWSGGDEVLARLTTPGAERFDVHPALLDASFQALAALLRLDGDRPAVPMGVDRMRVYGPVTTPAYAHVRRTGEMRADVRITDAQGQVRVEVDGLRVAPLEQETSSADDSWWHAVRFERAPLPAATGPAGRWVVLGDEAAAAALEEGGASVFRAGSVGDVLSAGSVRGYVCAAGEGDRPWSQALQLVQALLGREQARLVLLTRGAVRAGEEALPVQPLHTMLWGFGRALAVERPELGTMLVDWDGGPGLLPALLADSEDQIVLRGGERWVARLVPSAPSGPVLAPVGERAWKVEVGAVGQLDRLELVEVARHEPGPGQVELEIEAAGINFVDVLTALGALGTSVPELVAGGAFAGMGAEGAGRVVRTGPGVGHVRPGDRVLAVGSGCLARYTVTDARLVVPLPAELDTTVAAGLPIAWATALYALRDVARLQPGERLLVHSGTGGVGLAAIGWAQHVGAEVYATAGTEAKRERLRAMGVPFVSDSRSLRFVDDIRQWTAGEGVDVVLNSLAGPLLAAGVDLLRDHGRFVELGKRDVLEDTGLGLRPFLRNLSFTLVDLIGMMRKRPAVVGALLQDVVRLVSSGALPALPVTAVPADLVQKPFREMAAARHTGKLVVTPPSPGAVLRPAAPRPRRDGTYVVTGGLGGLGRAVALHLASAGAGHLLLLGRSARIGEEVARDLERMRAFGATVAVLPVDVADRQALARALGAAPLPVRGVVHAAGVLGEAAVQDLDERTFASVVDGKVQGALHLDALTRGQPVDFFVLFGSISAVVGSPGQAHYAAGNAMLDGLAARRRAEGLPATCLAWGPIRHIGMAATAEMEARFARMGVRYLAPEQMLAALDRALSSDVASAALLGLEPDGGLGMADKPFLSALSTRTADSGVRAELRAADGEARRELLRAWIRERIAAVIGAAPQDIGVTTSFSELGLDSLMALELRNRIQRDLGLSLSATVALSHDSVGRLSDHLLARLRDDAPAEAPEEEPLPELLSRATLPDEICGRGTPLVPAQRALLTGATGFLGAFLLSELLARGLVVHCLVRAPDEAAALERIRASLSAYGLWREDDMQNIVALPGDLARPRLGLSEAAFAVVADRVDLVVHAGALVHWVAPYAALAPVNVGATVEILKLCSMGRPKALHHVSTLGTVGVYHALGLVPPGTTAARLPTMTRPSGYFQTKFVAEQLVTAARERGVLATIWRPGLVTGDSKTGADSSTSGQFFASLVAGCVRMGVAPEWQGNVRIVPVDFVASAIAAGALRPDGQQRDLNLTNRRPAPLDSVVGTLRDLGYLVLSEPYPRWHADVLELPQVAPDNPLAPFAAFLARLPSQDGLALELFGSPDPLDDEAAQALLADAAVSCPPVEPALLSCYVRGWVTAGLMPAPPEVGDDEEGGTL
jgi:thioester reductase-like protein